MPSTSGNKRRTYTSRLQEIMDQLDEPATVPDLAALAELTNDQVSASVHHFEKHGMAEFIWADNQRWWYLTGSDDRERIIETRTPEPRPRRRRKKLIP